MAAPTNVGSFYTVTFSSLEEVGLTIINGFTAGNTVYVTLHQTGGIQRTITSLSDGTNSYAEAKKGSLSFAHTHLHYKTSVGTLSGGGVITCTLDGVSEGRLSAQEITASTFSSLTDNYSRSGTSTSQQCGATGLTTAADVYVAAVGCADGNHGGVTADDGYTSLVGAGQEIVLYKRSDTGLTATTAPWTSTNARGVSGAMAAFYAQAAAGGGAIVYNLQIG